MSPASFCVLRLRRSFPLSPAIIYSWVFFFFHFFHFSAALLRSLFLLGFCSFKSTGLFVSRVLAWIASPGRQLAAVRVVDQPRSAGLSGPKCSFALNSSNIFTTSLQPGSNSLNGCTSAPLSGYLCSWKAQLQPARLNYSCVHIHQAEIAKGSTVLRLGGGSAGLQM